MELLHRGHGNRILLSQDVCHTSQLRHYEERLRVSPHIIPAEAPRGWRVAGGDRLADDREPLCVLAIG